MKKIKLAYKPLRNAGDQFNVNLVERLSGRQVVCSKVYNADMTAIGGALVGLQYGYFGLRRLCLKLLGPVCGRKNVSIFPSSRIICMHGLCGLSKKPLQYFGKKNCLTDWVENLT